MWYIFLIERGTGRVIEEFKPISDRRMALAFARGLSEDIEIDYEPQVIYARR